MIDTITDTHILNLNEYVRGARLVKLFPPVASFSKSDPGKKTLLYWQVQDYANKALAYPAETPVEAWGSVAVRLPHYDTDLGALIGLIEARSPEVEWSIEKLAAYDDENQKFYHATANPCIIENHINVGGHFPKDGNIPSIALIGAYQLFLIAQEAKNVPIHAG